MSLVSTKWLNDNKEYVKIIDSSWHLPSEKRDSLIEFNIEHIPNIANEAVKIKAKIFWTQEGLYSEEAEIIAHDAGLKVIMDQCPKKILEKSN